MPFGAFRVRSGLAWEIAPSRLSVVVLGGEASARLSATSGWVLIQPLSCGVPPPFACPRPALRGGLASLGARGLAAQRTVMVTAGGEASRSFIVLKGGWDCGACREPPNLPATEPPPKLSSLLDVCGASSQTGQLGPLAHPFPCHSLNPNVCGFNSEFSVYFDEYTHRALFLGFASGAGCPAYG